ncbi:MAG TPA: SDR family oxidoreductase [Candidatus Hydrogenedentes bacterium]|nr:SDR family oxidoreductase [Candidatus Hydrogenedentota bacterium]HIJ74017.1 SDR family oxidoreductase [Candidatus Hydrogenedentota bacterium]
MTIPGRTILITGSSSGIGRETARLCHRRGWNVAATMRQPEEERELATFPDVICPRLDVTNEESIARAIQETIDRFGGIDVVVNNAGYAVVGPFEAASAEQMERQFAANVFGLMAVTKAVLPHFRSREAGTIINVASIGGRVAFPLFSLYHATKWAVEGFSESLQHELRPLGIRVKIIEPGPINTDFYGRSMDRAPAEALNEYHAFTERTMTALRQFGPRGASPARVARVIVKAAASQSWRLRYKTDLMGRLILLSRRCMPDWLFNGITRTAVMR